MPVLRNGSATRTKPVNKAVGLLLKAVRLRAGKSQTQMAKILDIEQTTLSRIEQGKREMGVRAWLILERKFEPLILEFIKLGKSKGNLYLAVKSAADASIHRRH